MRRLIIGALGLAAAAAIGCGGAGPKVGSQAWVDAAGANAHEWAARAGFELYTMGLPSMRACRVAVELHPNLTRAEVQRNLEWCEKAYK